MGKGISKTVGAQELDPVSLSALIHQHVRIAIETAVHEELRAALGTNPYERSEVRRGYRNRQGSKLVYSFAKKASELSATTRVWPRHGCARP